jgi:hypothetical protein
VEVGSKLWVSFTMDKNRQEKKMIDYRTQSPKVG